MLGQDMNISILGENLRARREAAGVSGNELARRTKIDQGNISKIENGKRPASKTEMERIEQFGGIGVTVAEMRDWAKVDALTEAIREMPPEAWPGLLKSVNQTLKRYEDESQ